jgi:amino acid transporter
MVSPLPPAHGVPTSAAAAPSTLTGRMGAMSLMLTVLAFSAPLAVVSGFIPLTLIFGGRGAPFGFVIATVALLLFSVGYVTMTKRVPKPGAFYAFITTGLGKVVGLGSAFLAVISYLLVLTGTYAFLGLSATALITSLGGPHTPWWIWALVGLAAVAILGYFNIELSAKVLSVAMVLEVVLVMIFNVFVLAKGGPEGLSAVPFTPTEFFKGDVGVTLLFATMVFMGFEATALFRDEVRTPNKTIPRATYGAVLFVGVLYTLSCYALDTSYGSQSPEVAAKAPADMFPTAIGQFVAPMFTQISLVLVCSSIFAALLSIHNVIARYVYNLGSDRAFPSRLSSVHSKHGSPALASHLVAGMSVAVIVLIAVLHLDEAVMYAQLVGLGSLGVLFLMALVSLAVIVWFARQQKYYPENPLKSYVAPAIAALTLTAVVVLAIIHFELVVGGAPGEYTWLVLLLGLVFIVGVALALYFRRSKPHLYTNLGRADQAPAEAASDLIG